MMKVMCKLKLLRMCFKQNLKLQPFWIEFNSSNYKQTLLNFRKLTQDNVKFIISGTSGVIRIISTTQEIHDIVSKYLV